jgi:hypothetical protein
MTLLVTPVNDAPQGSPTGVAVPAGADAQSIFSATMSARC